MANGNQHGKTVVMSVTNKKTKLNFPYGTGNGVLRTVTEKKYLGVIISDNLSSKTQVQNITKKQ